MRDLRSWIIAAFTVLATLPSSAGDSARFGVRVSYDMTTSTRNSYLTGWGSGFSVGGVYYAPFGKMTFFQSGLSFCINNISLNGATRPGHNFPPFDRFIPHIFDGTIRTIGLRMPLDFGLRIVESKAFNLKVYTGPHLYFNLSAKMICDVTYNEKTEHINEKFKTSGMEIGWGLGVGVNLFRRWHIFMQGVYNLSDLGSTYRFRDDDEISYIRRAEISIGLGYNF